VDPAAFAQPATLAAHCDPPRFGWQNRPAGFWTPPHVELMSTTARDLIVAGDGHLLTTMPPRHGKSTLLDLWLPIWVLCVWPFWRFVLVTHTQQLADKWGREVRDLIRQHEDKLPIRVSSAKSSANEFDIAGQREGGFLALGIGGAFPGRGADVLSLDDPIKSPVEANSETWRERVWDYWQSVCVNRMEPGGSQLVTMTRWHEDDPPSGRSRPSSPRRRPRSRRTSPRSTRSCRQRSCARSRR
jgi:hypothetical protein